MKKLLLGLGTVATAAITIGTAVSCSMPGTTTTTTSGGTDSNGVATPLMTGGNGTPITTLPTFANLTDFTAEYKDT